MPSSPASQPSPDLPPGLRAALVIATTEYADPDLVPLTAPAQDARAVTEILGDPAIGGFTVTQVLDADERDTRRAIAVFLSSRGAADVVLVYLSCHGVTDRRGRLYFAATDTLRGDLLNTGVPAALLMEQLEDCRARQKMLILDCCYSGAFARGSKGSNWPGLEQQLSVSGRGLVVLTASRGNERSYEGQAVPSAAITGSVFTAGLLEGLRTGAADVGRTGYISVNDAYDYAARYVRATGAAQTPTHSLSGGEGAIILARSPAGLVITPAPLPDDLRAALEHRHLQMRIGAVHVLGDWLTGGDPGRALTAKRHLREVADTDHPAVSAAAQSYLAAEPTASMPLQARTASVPDLATRILYEAERTAESIDESDVKASVLGDIAELLAPADPDHAERIARAITVDGAGAWTWDSEGPPVIADAVRAETLNGIAKALAPTDPDRAARLFADAERTARSIDDAPYKAATLSNMASTLAPTDPDRAERIAQTITDASHQASALSAIAKELSITSPDQAQRIAQTITSEPDQALALTVIAEILAPTDPDRAQGIAQTITNSTYQQSALRQIARALAPADPQRAERIARSLTNSGNRDSALRSVAPILALTDPDQALQIARSITGKAFRAWALGDIAQALAPTSPQLATRLFAEAEHTARTIDNAHARASALNGVAWGLVPCDPIRAVEIAQSITDARIKASALSGIVRELAPSDPNRALRITQSITDSTYKAYALSNVARALAATAPDRAQDIARSITIDRYRQEILIMVARSLAPTDPDRAQDIARSITDVGIRAHALCRVAEAVIQSHGTAAN